MSAINGFEMVPCIVDVYTNWVSKWSFLFSNCVPYIEGFYMNWVSKTNGSVLKYFKMSTMPCRFLVVLRFATINAFVSNLLSRHTRKALQPPETHHHILCEGNGLEQWSCWHTQDSLSSAMRVSIATIFNVYKYICEIKGEIRKILRRAFLPIADLLELLRS